MLSQYWTPYSTRKHTDLDRSRYGSDGINARSFLSVEICLPNHILKGS